MQRSVEMRDWFLLRYYVHICVYVSVTNLIVIASTKATVAHYRTDPTEQIIVNSISILGCIYNFLLPL